MNFDVGGRNVRLADIAEVRREYSDPPDPMFRINGKPGLGLAISMRDGGDVLALGENIHHTMDELKKDLPIGIEPIMVANQPDTVHHSINEFMEALWESIAIVLVVSVLSPGGIWNPWASRAAKKRSPAFFMLKSPTTKKSRSKTLHCSLSESLFTS